MIKSSSSSSDLIEPRCLSILYWQEQVPSCYYYYSVTLRVPPWGTSLAPSVSETKHTVQQGKVCWHYVLDCGLGPSLLPKNPRFDKTQTVTKLKNSNVDKTQKLKMWQNLKKNSNCDKKNTQIVEKLKNQIVSKHL